MTLNKISCHSLIQTLAFLKTYENIYFIPFLKTTIKQSSGSSAFRRRNRRYDIKPISISRTVYYQIHIDISVRISNTYRYLRPYIKRISISWPAYQTHIDILARISNTYRYLGSDIKHISIYRPVYQTHIDMPLSLLNLYHL